MIKSLMLDAHNLLNERDFASINKWTNEKSFMIMDEPNDYDDIILPEDINRLLVKRNTPDDKVYIQMATSRTVREIVFTCRRRFKPIYSRLILPLVSLSNIGFNYQGAELSAK